MNFKKPIIKLIKLEFLSNNQYMAPYVLFTYFLNSKKSVPPLPQGVCQIEHN